MLEVHYERLWNKLRKNSPEWNPDDLEAAAWKREIEGEEPLIVELVYFRIMSKTGKRPQLKEVVEELANEKRKRLDNQEIDDAGGCSSCGSEDATESSLSEDELLLKKQELNSLDSEKLDGLREAVVGLGIDRNEAKEDFVNWSEKAQNVAISIYSGHQKKRTSYISYAEMASMGVEPKTNVNTPSENEARRRQHSRYKKTSEL